MFVKKLFKYRLLSAFLSIYLVSIPTLAASLEKDLETYGIGNLAVAIEKLKPLAEKGDAKAQYNLGRVYHAKSDKETDKLQKIALSQTAADCFHKAVEQGYEDARLSLSVMQYNLIPTGACLQRRAQCTQKLYRGCYLV
jgi:TPR repeat protein